MMLLKPIGREGHMMCGVLQDDTGPGAVQSMLHSGSLTELEAEKQRLIQQELPRICSEMASLQETPILQVMSTIFGFCTQS